MDDLGEGLYENLIDERLAERISHLAGDLVVRRELRSAEAADRIALFASRQVERAIQSVPESERADVGVAVLVKLLEDLSERLPRAVLDRPAVPASVLSEIRRRLPDGSTGAARQPLIPLLDTTLLTNSPGEPRVGSQIHDEIGSADRIDVVMAFVRRTGVRPLAEQLRAHCRRGRSLRVLTTTYTGSTELAALEMLRDLGAVIRVSYDTSLTRLHAKAWIFHRRSGFSTAYVGSSNLTHSAQVSGMEWNVRVSGARNPAVIDKITAVFDGYWNSGDFVPFDVEEFVDRTAASAPAGTGTILSPLEVRLEPFQERLLELIAVARRKGRHRNLLVAATGTGKTVMSAVDYAVLRRTTGWDRLLFVAHREEILDQSLGTFRQVLRDHAFGEKWVGRSRPVRFDQVFASVQSLAASGIEHIAADHFHVVIIDEFHHAAAPSYRVLLEHLQPRELLGLTATPERSDGLPVLQWFDGRIAAELRLWDAIDQHRLVPFSYYGIHDGVDLRDVPWRRGQGYDTATLSGVYTGNDVRVRLVIQQLQDKVGDTDAMRCLGFCVSVAHAEFMAASFTAHGIPAVAVSGDTPTAARSGALRDLRSGAVRVLFSVDLFNEGVDLPDVDVLLMLRPTESPTLFLQQLGRGLRRSPGKTVCTVLDFIGNHRREFRFDRRFRALLGGGRRDVESAIDAGFPFLPAGSHMELDPVASQVVLRSLREAIPSQWPAKVKELQELRQQKGSVTLPEFLDDTGLELGDVYSGGRTWSDLCEAAGAPTLASGPREADLRRAVGRMLHIDDEQRISVFRALLDLPAVPQVESLTALEVRLARMLVSGFGSAVVPAGSSLQDALDILWAHPQVRVDIAGMLGVRAEQIEHLHAPVDLPGVPLQVHARYTRQEILAAVGEGDGALTPPWREGVRDAKHAGADLLVFTLDKTSGQFSPTTRYRDYAISRELIHWESQSNTRESSPTGQRYQHHRSMGRSILLFARERADDRAFWFLGPAQYVSHTGELPMAVTWRLDVPLPGDLFEAFAAAVA